MVPTDSCNKLFQFQFICLFIVFGRQIMFVHSFPFYLIIQLVHRLPQGLTSKATTGISQKLFPGWEEDTDLHLEMEDSGLESGLFVRHRILL